MRKCHQIDVYIYKCGVSAHVLLNDMLGSTGYCVAFGLNNILFDNSQDMLWKYVEEVGSVIKL